MKISRIIILLSILALLMAACTPSAPTGVPEPTAAATDAVMVEPTAYPDGGAVVQQPSMDSAYPVMAGDENKSQANFFADQIELKPNAGNPAHTDVVVTGSLPTPCHELRAFVNPPDANNIVNVQIYSVVDTEKVCTQVLSPYEGVAATIKDLPAGVYSVVSNNQPLGEIEVK
jgi:hypothetical protein